MSRNDLMFGVAAAVLGVALGVVAGQAAPTATLSYRDLLARRIPLADRRIAYGPGASQFGELWLPAAGRRRGVIVVIHGGCWRSDLPGLELMNAAADDLRRRGFAVWNIEYRRLGATGGGYPETFEDVALGLDYLRVLSRSDHLDLGHVVVLGHSAGGHLALWAAARPRLPVGSSLRQPRPLRVAGVITLAGINDLAAYHADGPDACGGPSTIDQLVGAEHRTLADRYADTSPAAMLPLGVPQTVVSGELDPIVPARFGHAYAQRATAAGDSVREVTEPGAGHFELIDPRSSAWNSVVRETRRLARRPWGP